MGTAWVTSSPESSTRPVLVPLAYKASTGAGTTYRAAVSNVSNLGARAGMECVSEGADGLCE